MRVCADARYAIRADVSASRRIRGALPDASPPRAALSLLAEPLRRCVGALVTRAPDWGAAAAGGIAAAWPPPSEAAAAKGELLLAAIEDVISAAGPRGGAAALAAAQPAFAAALRGEHAGSAARAAAAAAAPGVLAAARFAPAAAMQALVPLLVGDATRHWSADVNAARHAALLALRVRCDAHFCCCFCAVYAMPHLLTRSARSLDSER
jgi:hypothetical protein